jgi:hypothetical protein
MHGDQFRGIPDIVDLRDIFVSGHDNLALVTDVSAHCSAGDHR